MIAGASKLTIVQTQHAVALGAIGSVTRIYTNIAVIDVTRRGFFLLETALQVSFDDVQARTGAKLYR